MQTTVTDNDEQKKRINVINKYTKNHTCCINTLRFLSRCLRMDTAFLIRQYKSSGIFGASPWAFRIRKILLPVTWRTWATPWESRRMTPDHDQISKHHISISYYHIHASKHTLCFFSLSQTMTKNCPTTWEGLIFQHLIGLPVQVLKVCFRGLP